MKRTKRGAKTPRNKQVVAQLTPHSLANPAHATRVCEEVPLLRYIWEYVTDGITMLNLSLGKKWAYVQRIARNGNVKVDFLMNLSYVQQVNHFSAYIDKLPEALQETTLSLSRLDEIKELKAGREEDQRIIAYLKREVGIYERLTVKSGG